MLSFFNNVVYVQLSPELLTVRNPKTGQSVSERLARWWPLQATNFLALLWLGTICSWLCAITVYTLQT